MKSYKMYLSSLLAVSLLAACNKNNNESAANPGANLIPDKIQFTPPPVGPELTKEQAAQIKKAFTVKSMMELPPGELIFPDKNMPQSELAKKEQALKKKDPNSYELMLEMRSGCRKGHPTIHMDATFPAESGTVDASILEFGDRFDLGGSAALAGQNCPVDASAGLGYSAEITNKDVANKEIQAKAGASYKVTAVMKDPRYAALLGARGMIVDSSISGLAAQREIVGDKLDRGLMTFKVSGSYLSLQADIPYSAEVKVLGSGNHTAPITTTTESTVDIKLTMPTFAVNLVAYETRVNDKQTSVKYYLNGHEKTAQELNDLFGNNIPGSSLSQSPVVQALK